LIYPRKPVFGGGTSVYPKKSRCAREARDPQFFRENSFYITRRLFSAASVISALKHFGI
jgi:hypothetical protein